MKVMLDTNIFDRLIAVAGLVDLVNRKSRAGDLQILTTPIQEAELANIPDKAKRRAAQNVDRLVVPNVAEVPLVPSSRHLRDALIGASACAQADVLVTEDAAFARRVNGSAAACRVISFAEFRTLIIGKPQA